MSARSTAHEGLTNYLRTSLDALTQSISYCADNRAERAIELITKALRANLPLLVCGNGGSAADAEHIAGELVGRFLRTRRAFNVICLSSSASVLTAWANDCSYEGVFARQVEAHGQGGGVLLAISTSGNSPNVVAAARQAKALGLPVVALTGLGGGSLASHSDVLLDVPCSSTPLIQQVHVCIYHFICERLELALAE
jgi:D-sedoheptulose 7-phosphate isomerase